MFKRRAILVRLSKDADLDEPYDARPIEEKTEAVLSTLEKAAVKVFVGMCIYMMLDTHRQVAVAKAVHNHK